ncbi:MAG TPA: U32 family peptidase, partial [Terriglobales bacterium]|nr:U32 family peptidase [Terriglobales bacterium]
RQEDWAMRSVGMGVLSGKDVCMLEHLPELLAAGCGIFRIEAAYETPAYRSSIANIYRSALQRTAAGDGTVDELAWHTVRQHTAVGLCNGFYFGRTGGEYVGNQGALAEVCWVGTR